MCQGFIDNQKLPIRPALQQSWIQRQAQTAKAQQGRALPQAAPIETLSDAFRLKTGLAGAQPQGLHRNIPRHRQGEGAAQQRLTAAVVSQAALSRDLGGTLGLSRPLVAVKNTRGGIGKHSMVHNALMPSISVDPETYEVTADGALLTCEPAEVLSMAQRYFLF